MENNRSKVKKIDYLGWLILLTIIVSTYFLHVQLHEIRHTLETTAPAKTEITNIQQFSELCEQLSKQWDADGYAFYLLQPKSTIKTYKEKATSSVNNIQLPIHAEVSDKTYRETLHNQRYLIANKSDAVNILDTNDLECNYFVIIPVYQYDVIIGEFYVMYNDTIDSTKIQKQIVEAQSLSKLIR